MMSFCLYLVCFALATFFSGMETAFLSSNKLQLELEELGGGFGARILLLFEKKYKAFAATLTIGFYLSVLLAVICLLSFFRTVLPIYPGEWLISNVLIPAGVLIISGSLAELLAQTIFAMKPNRLLKRFWIPLLLFFIVFYPIAQSFVAVVDFIKLLRNDMAGNEKAEHLFVRNVGKIPSVTSNQELDFRNKQLQDLKIFQNALVFSKVRIRDCMVPRTELECIDIESSVEELRTKFIDSGYSKILVYSDSVDNIEGFISSKELFKHPGTIREKISPVTFVPETMPANKLLHEFMQLHRSIAVVVDEYGGTSGMVTLEDIMEKIFGEIEDEHDTDDMIEKQIRPNEFVFSSRLEIEYLNSVFDLGIPESEDYSTLAGFILFHHNNLPKPKDVVKIGRFSIKILKVSHTRIELVLLKVTEE